MDQRLGDSLAPRRFYLTLIGTFAAIAVILAALGVYSVMSYLLARRTREFGIRIALGAQPGQVRGLVLSETLMLATLGGLGGLAGAVALTRYLKTMLYGVSEVDDATFVVAAVVLVAVAIGASLIPAHRASRVDPMVALREE